MRILYFSLGYTAHDRRFLDKMAEPGHEVFFLRLQDDRSTEVRSLPPGVRDVRFSGLTGAVTPERCLSRLPALARVLEEVRPDLVHAGPIPNCAFMVALTGFRPLLAMSWGSDLLVDACEDELAGWAARYALTRSDLFVVDCDAVHERIVTIAGAAPDRFVRLPWGLELARFPRLPPRPAAREEVVVLSTRSWAPIYGIETVLASFALAQQAEPRLRLVLLGDGPLAPAVDRIIEGRGLSALIRRPGRVPEEEIGRHFAGADVYMSCAVSDGTSVSLLEAMAHGLPVVATDAPGNREWVTEESGWLAPAHDAPAFARALLNAAHLNDADRAHIAAHNRQLVETRADWHVNARRLLAAYDRLAPRRA